MRSSAGTAGLRAAVVVVHGVELRERGGEDHSTEEWGRLFLRETACHRSQELLQPGGNIEALVFLQ